MLDLLSRLPQESIGDSVAIQRHFETFASQSSGGSDSDPIVLSILVSLQRELSVRLQDRRVDVTSAIEAVRLLIERTNAETIRILGELPDELAECMGNDTILETIVSHHVATRLQTVSVELDKLKSRFEDLATLLARAIQQLNQDENLAGNPWEHMPAEIASRYEQTLGHLHQQVASPWLLRFIQHTDSELNPAELVSRVSEVTIKLIKTTLESIAPAVNTLVAADSRTTLTHFSSPSLAATHALAPSDSTTAGPTKIKPQSSIETSLAAARPALLACGGRQRLILLVGSDSERTRLEAEVREVHAGALTVAVIPGTTPMLIHEAQQIKLDDVINRLTMMAAGSHQVTQRLHSRSDIEWATPEPR